ncbi:hypothetical protein HELRODRAFT_163770 [Helobdella robusta]|uniref:EGF-like domain-containing protein n=1 Tax=Helobdella robusta TaxID=6412 RepID=T1EUG1_HELRO|nr:hypothetical protein HELRODRAFT_163770 [Helobdella robusta]ESN96674.1 hypothetical protein HELRODRAFT_163770 [Helobdella robusta]
MRNLAINADRSNWMVFDLGEFCRVEYVVLYNVVQSADGYLYGSADRMEKFSVGLLLDYVVGSLPTDNKKCGTHPSCSNVGDVCRLNCSQPFQKSKYVLLFSNAKDYTVNVAEFQICGDNISIDNRTTVKITRRHDQLPGDLTSSDHCGVACPSDDHLCGAPVSNCTKTSDSIECNGRNCSVNNGMCGAHTCKTNLVGPSDISEYVCNVGYDKNFYSGDCIDINECSLNANLCPLNISTCVNTAGSYVCSCTDGYVKSGQNSCTALLKNINKKKFFFKEFSEIYCHLQWYTDWPDVGLPNNVGSLLNFHHHMKSFLETKNNFDKNLSNIVVLCETGVGASRIFIGLNYLIERCEDKSVVEVLQCVKNLRSHRNHVVQTEEEYDFLYQSMIFYHNLGHTCFSISDDSFTKFLNSETFIKCFNKSNAFLACEIGKNIKGSVLYGDVLGDGSIIVFIDSKPTKQNALQLLIPDSGKKLTFHKITIENNGETNHVYKTANCINSPSTVALTLTKNDDEINEDDIYKNDNVYNKLSNHGRSIKIHSLESIDQIQSLYNLLKDSIKNQKCPAIPLLYKYVFMCRI